MGAGRYSSETYAATAGVRNATGQSFNFSRTVMSQPRSERKVHDDLDPKRTNNSGPFAGMMTREAADSAEHPTSLPIAVLFDVTGSMRQTPIELQRELPNLLGLIQQNGYVEHPQILFGAIGDAYSDRVPLQISQFESDNRMDDHIEKIVLEGNGGSQNHESYELALYFMARHTELDSVTKRHHKGYLFIIGDELPYDEVNNEQVMTWIGDGFQETITFEDVLAEAQQKYEVYYILPRRTTHGDNADIIEFWTKHLGPNMLRIDTINDVCETIGLTVATREAILDPLI